MTDEQIRKRNFTDLVHYRLTSNVNVRQPLTEIIKKQGRQGRCLIVTSGTDTYRSLGHVPLKFSHLFSWTFTVVIHL